jgi:hypothetical protein
VPSGEMVVELGECESGPGFRILSALASACSLAKHCELAPPDSPLFYSATLRFLGMDVDDPKAIAACYHLPLASSCSLLPEAFSSFPSSRPCSLASCPLGDHPI